MKKTTVFVLVWTLILGLIQPVVAVGSSQTELTESAYDLVFDLNEAEILKTEDAIHMITTIQERARRTSATENNLIFPGTLMEKCTFMPSNQTRVSLGMYQSGKSNQYWVLLVYDGDSVKGEPVLTVMDKFDREYKGFYTMHTYINTSQFHEGRYTLVTCTAEPKGDTLYPVEGTAYMTDIYCYETYVKRWSIFAQDPTTGERLDVIRMSVDMPMTISMGRAPLPSAGAGECVGYCPEDLVEVEGAGGYFFLTPKRCGYGSFIITHDSNKIKEIPLYVCTSKKGHIAGSTTPALEPTITEKGLYTYVCSSCGCVYREDVPSLETSFGKFTDLSQDTWYYSYVQEAFYRGLFKGVSENQFQPKQAMNRAMLVTVLWRAEGSPEGFAPQFKDVKSNAWYYEAVNWAAAQGIVNGVGKGKFDPLGKITREQMATILYRYSRLLDLPGETEDKVAAFADWKTVSPWAVEAMNWNLSYGTISGVKQGNTVYLDPKGEATRGQVSAILVRFLKAFEEPEPTVQLPDTTNGVDYGKWGDIYWVFFENGTLQIGGVGEITALSSSAYSPWAEYLDRITKVEILYGVTAVGTNAFRNHTALESVVIGESVTRIDAYGFFGCSALKQVKLPKNLQIIGDSAFEGCGSLEHLELPYGIRAVRHRAFALCTSLKEMILPSSITGYPLGSSGTVFTDGIGQEVFYCCFALEYVEMPIAVRHIPYGFFYDCTSLKEVVIPLCVEYIYDKAFNFCSSLERVVIMTNLTEITEGNFAYCTSLREVYVLSDVYTTVNTYPISGYKEDLYVFGDAEQVTLYGLPGSTTEEIAKLQGYSFVDVRTVMLPD